MEKEILWKMLAEIFEVDLDGITEHTLLEDELWADELDLQELEFMLDEEFSIQLPSPNWKERLETLTAGDLLTMVQEALQKQGRAEKMSSSESNEN